MRQKGIWDKLRLIHNLCELPQQLRPPEFEILSSSSIPEVFPIFKDLGPMISAYQTIELRIVNPGMSELKLLEMVSSEPHMAVCLNMENGPMLMEPQSISSIFVLIRAVGLVVGEYKIRLSLSYQRNGAQRLIEPVLFFSVHHCSNFSIDVYPPYLRCEDKIKGEFSVECCNYSDIKGEVIVRHEGFSPLIADRIYQLGPREAITHTVVVRNSQTECHKGNPRICFENASTGVKRLVPLLKSKSLYQNC